MVGNHAWLKIVVTHEVGNIGNLVLKSLLTGKHRGTSRVESLHYGVKFTGAVYSLIVSLPCLAHLVAYAPYDYRRMVTVAKNHVGDVLMGIVVVERLVISRLPLVESLVEHKKSECVADGEELRRRRIV